MATILTPGIFGSLPNADCPRFPSPITAILTVSIFGQLNARACLFSSKVLFHLTKRAS